MSILLQLVVEYHSVKVLYSQIHSFRMLIGNFEKNKSERIVRIWKEAFEVRNVKVQFVKLLELEISESDQFD